MSKSQIGKPAHNRGKFSVNVEGRQFGKLSTVCRTGPGDGKNIFVKCVCKCGEEVVARWSSLTRGQTVSCGCTPKRRAYEDLTGKRFGRLVVAGQVPRIGGVRSWACDCDCGNRIFTIGGSLITRGTRSCGCLSSETRRTNNVRANEVWRAMHPPGTAARNNVLSMYKCGASTRGLDWNLTDDEATNLFKGDCFYCGCPPGRVSRSKNPKNGEFKYNGIDRMDSSVGYIHGNVVSCCFECNWLKGKRSIDQLMQTIGKIAARHPECLTSDYSKVKPYRSVKRIKSSPSPLAAR